MKKIKIIGMIVALILIVGVIILLSQPVTYYLSHIEEFKIMLKSKGPLAALIIFLLQVLQVVVAFIPSDGISIISGYILGTWWGFLVSYTGIMLGSVLAFYLARFFGRPLVERFVKKEKLAKIEEKVNSNVTTGGLFIMCFIPFMPRDVLVYTLGMTPIKPKRFFIVYAIARFPLIFIMSFAGNSLFSQEKLALGAGAIFIVYILLTWGFKKKKLKTVSL